MTRFALALCLAATLTLPVLAQDQTTTETKPATTAQATPAVSSESAQHIRKLLALNGEAKAALNALNLALAAEKANTDIPPAFWEKFKASFTEEDFILLAIPIYAKHYTPEEIDGLIAFYESPLGKKVQSETAAIQNEAAQAGEALGRKKALEIMATMPQEKKPATAAPKKPAPKKRK